MRRPQKPFTVEVKRIRKGAGAKILVDETPKKEAVSREWPRPIAAPAPVPAQSQPAPPRRILEAIEPPPVVASATETIVADTTVRRGRGRPRKSVDVVNDGEAVRVIPRIEPVVVRARPKPRPAAAPVEAPFVFAPPAPVLEARPRDRANEADNLPRGERWKRRLPKVLW